MRSWRDGLPGTEDAALPFFSHDGNSVGFWRNGVLSRVSVDGGAPVRMGELPERPRGAAWAPDGSIILGGSNVGLQRIGANGGVLVTLTQPAADRGEQYHAWPTMLPDGIHVLFTIVTGEGPDIGMLSLETEEWHILEGTAGGAQPHYLSSGHLVFFRSGGLFAAGFDVTESVRSVSAVLVQDDVMAGRSAGLELGVFALSRSGTLMHGAAELEPEQNRVLLVDREGSPQPLPIGPGGYGFGLSVSPDGRRMATSERTDHPSGDCWVHDLELGGRTRLTDQNACIYPVWSHDGVRVIFAYSAGGPESFDIHWMPADRSAVRDVLLTAPRDQFPTSVSVDGRFLAYTTEHPETRTDFHLLTIDGDRVSSPFRAIGKK